MMWRVSDYVVLLLSAAAASNVLMAWIFLCRSFFEQGLGMRQWNIFLKLAIYYLLFLMPVLSGYILYTSTFHGIIAIVGEDFSRARIIGNRSISVQTQWGNHGIFIALILIWGIGILYFGILGCLRNLSLLKKIEKYSEPDQDAKNRTLKRQNRTLKILEAVGNTLAGYINDSWQIVVNLILFSRYYKAPTLLSAAMEEA